MKVLVTGAAGFVGAATVQALLGRGDTVVGFDNVNDYYDVRLKEARLQLSNAMPGNYRFVRGDVSDVALVAKLFQAEGFDAVVHLAAQAGVRYSLENPLAYVQSNLLGFTSILEACRHHPVRHLVYASSSSVYGANAKQPFSTDDKTDQPVSFYAATKKANELMAHSYAHLYNIPATALRFFTVYGPWGRPDMAPMLFARSILQGKPIQVFNHGNMKRDFTYVDDIVSGVIRVLDRPPHLNELRTVEAGSSPYHDVFNIGRGEPVDLMEFVSTLEDALGRKAIIEFQGMQQGDVPITYADTARLSKEMGYAPRVGLKDGLASFAPWYRENMGKLF